MFIIFTYVKLMCVYSNMICTILLYPQSSSSNIFHGKSYSYINVDLSSYGYLFEMKYFSPCLPDTFIFLSSILPSVWKCLFLNIRSFSADIISVSLFMSLLLYQSTSPLDFIELFLLLVVFLFAFLLRPSSLLSQ